MTIPTKHHCRIPENASPNLSELHRIVSSVFADMLRDAGRIFMTRLASIAGIAQCAREFVDGRGLDHYNPDGRPCRILVAPRNLLFHAYRCLSHHDLPLFESCVFCRRWVSVAGVVVPAAAGG
jgi:hypothetical protein